MSPRPSAGSEAGAPMPPAGAALPLVVALVGRPNVGKSTLFNRIVGQRRSIVEDEPGTTRDRSYGPAEWGGRHFLIVDTAGLGVRGLDQVAHAAEDQAKVAVDEAGLLVMLVDVTTGITEQDAALARTLRRGGKAVILAVNKCDSEGRHSSLHEFHALGLGEPMPISAYHGRGVPELLDRVIAALPDIDVEPSPEDGFPKFAIIGRPNAGKSSLYNCLLGENRALVSELPGTTRDSIDTVLQFGDRGIVMVDTAGLRRRGRVSPGVERHSVLRALASVKRADVCILIIDANAGATDQDAHIAGFVLESMRGLVIVATKWDLVSQEEGFEADFDKSMRLRFRFVAHAPLLKVSAVTDQNVDAIIPTALRVFEATRTAIPTSRLNRYLLEWSSRRPPPARKGSITRLRYVTQTGANPPTFRLFFSDPRHVSRSYLRYLENGLRKEFGLEGTPVRMVTAGGK